MRSSVVFALVNDLIQNSAGDFINALISGLVNHLEPA